MEQFTAYSQTSQYRDDFRIQAFRFGSGKKALAVVGSLRGNEHQQLFCCAQLVKRLEELEAADRLVEGNEILVIPCGNPWSMNIRKRFWSIDNTDINRMFPGYDKGETTQRVAAAVFEAVKDYEMGIQFASFYMRGSFAPHIRLMRTGFEDVERAKQFGLPYVIIRNPRPFDTTTLNYNWQIWETSAFSLYTTSTEVVNRESAAEAVEAILRFMMVNGLVKPEMVPGEISLQEPDDEPDYGSRSGDSSLGKTTGSVTVYAEESTPEKKGKQPAETEAWVLPPFPVRVISDDDLVTIRTHEAGFFHGEVRPGYHVAEGEELARIEDPYDGHIRAQIIAPVSGNVLFMHDEDMCYADSAIYKLIT